MKITQIDTVQIGLPRRRAHRISQSPTAAGDPIGTYVIVRLRTDRHLEGLGEAPVFITWGGDHMMYYGESPSTVIHIIRDHLASVLEGQDPFAIETIHTLMDRRVRGHPYAKAAIDMALYDLIGKALDVPAYQLLGGLTREWVPIAHSIGILPIDQTVAEACQAVEEGMKVIKLKVGIEPDQDVERVARVRAAVGPSIGIFVDGNQGYTSPYIAIRTIRAMQNYDLMFAEQPVEGIDEMSQVARSVDVPLMADESAWTPRDILRIAKAKAASYISLYTTKPGGLFPAKKVAAVAEAAGLTCNVNGSLETGVGNAANLHLASSTRVVTLHCVLPVTRLKGKGQGIAGVFYLDDIIREPFAFEDGRLHVPEGPGLGIKLDEDKIETYRVR